MHTFSIPRITADRLARLGLACADDKTIISHIGVRITPSLVRFSATNGRILASVIIPIEDFQGTPGDIILDKDQLIAAIKSTAKATGGRICFRIDDQEARMTHGTVAAVVRCVPGTFPAVDHVWTRPAGQRWVPTMSCIDPILSGIAQKITGVRSAVLFSSPVNPGVGLERLWAVPGAKTDENIGLSTLRAAVTAPAYWCDHELAILIMPITRSDAERQLDLEAHALIQPQATSLAA